MTSRSLILAVAVSLAICPALCAEIIITPPEPLSTQEVNIELTRQYPFEAAIVSASIALDGNVFTISQTVETICTLANAPILTSDFDVGALPGGAYDVVAEIELISLVPDCDDETVIETSSFTVGDPAVAVPTLGTAGMALAAGLLLVAGVRRLRASASPPAV